MSDFAAPPPPEPEREVRQGVAEAPWLRLDPRMLLLQPLTEVARFLPALIPLFLFGTASGFGPLALIGVLGPLAFGVARYLTTDYRIHDGRIELRRGVLQRRTTSARLERVRTVDMTATLVQRILGVAKLVIGTGGAGDEDDRLELDGLARERAVELRSGLLERRREPLADRPGSPLTETAPAGSLDQSAPPPQPAQVVARFTPRWLLYAPFTSAGFVAAAALVGVGSQAIPSAEFEIRIGDPDLARIDALLVAIVVGGAIVASAVLTIGGYLLTNWGFTLSRSGGSWHVRRGLTTTRETSLDVDRVAGVSMAEGLALRSARGAHLRAIVTGLGAGSSDSAVLVPPAPVTAVRDAAGGVLGGPAPMGDPLRTHGRRAAQRRWTRALAGTIPVHLAVAALLYVGAPVAVLALSALAVAVAAGLAADRSRGLGHGWLGGHVVMRSGSLARRRTALAGGHVIGWTLRESWFQRRAGLATLTATTAGGSGKTEVHDVPVAAALTLADEATPGLLTQFRS